MRGTQLQIGRAGAARIARNLVLLVSASPNPRLTPHPKQFPAKKRGKHVVSIVAMMAHYCCFLAKLCHLFAFWLASFYGCWFLLA